MNSELQKAVDECTEFDPLSMYLMFLVGATEGRDVPAEEMAKHGEWQQGYPLESGQVIFDGEWDEDNFRPGPAMRHCSGVSFAWFYAGDAPEFEMCHGPVVSPVRAWMEVPWVPEIWGMALAERREDNDRRAQLNAAR